MKRYKICVMGLGYIGLPTATVFALAGQQVIGVDINPTVIAMLNQGDLPFSEPQLQAAVQQAMASGQLTVGAEPIPADVFIIAVPTPLNEDLSPNLTYVEQAVTELIPLLEEGNLIVLESTSPVGTTSHIAQKIRQARPDLKDLRFAYCPERVLPGNILTEIYENDRIIGGESRQATEQAVALYRFFAKGACLPTTDRLAEMCKLTENSFRDVNIAFANELSMICDHLNLDVWQLIELANRHPRVNILQPGAGVGGHCIAVDPWFMVSQSPAQAKLIRTAREVNDRKADWVLEKIKAKLAECLTETGRPPKEITIACLGLSFKADVEDLRESPALSITEQLADWHKGEVWVVDPHIHQLPDSLQGKVSLVPLSCAVEQADIVVRLVDHQYFKTVSVQDLSTSWWLDTRGIWSE